ncbi:flavin reductase (NADPH)-like isoform X2 [Amphiura filiformis]|uniref:flavin reductase (NADPH)-like isoform X2 n=1 Tax=Amphiura filiformis TaxID=82378 RepID=UPI003B21C33C
MKLVILGATGPTGQCLVTQALDAGHEVTAVVRNTDKMTTTHDKLKVVTGDIFSESSLQEQMSGQDAVLSCLGSHDGWMAEVTLYTESIKSIVGAMRAANVTRVICLTAWCTTDEKGTFMIDWIMKPLFLKKILKNMGTMEEYLIGCEDINYTVVKPPGLGSGNVTEKEIKTEFGQYVNGGAQRIIRADVARFMISCLNTDTWEKKLVSIAY